MRVKPLRFKPWLLWLAAVVTLAALLFGIDWYRHRYVRQNRDLVRLLPPGDLSLIYVDLGLLRRADMLGVLANIKIAPDKEYADFIRQTNFDYTRDLDCIAIGSGANQIWMVGRGRFQWEKLKGFAAAHQGSCDNDSCRVPATAPGRWVNFVVVQPDVLAVAISSVQDAADNLRPPGRRVWEQIPDAPVWGKTSRALLASPAALPLPVQIFAISMQSAESVVLIAQPDNLQLKAHFPNGATADTARRQMEIQTRTLVSALKGNGTLDRASFAALLAGGSFQVVGTDLQGRWPLYPELIKALQ